MGLSISASVAIIFIASVIVFGTLFGAFDNAQKNVLDAQRAAETRTIDRQDTHFSILALDVGNHTLKVVNDGGVTLRSSELDLFIDGVLANNRVNSTSIDGAGPTALWMPDEILTIELTGELEGVSIKVVSENGAEAYL